MHLTMKQKQSFPKVYGILMAVLIGCLSCLPYINSVSAAPKSPFVKRGEYSLSPRLARQYDNLSGLARSADWPSKTQAARAYRDHGKSVGATSLGEYHLSAKQTINDGVLTSYTNKNKELVNGYWDRASGKFTVITDSGIQKHQRLSFNIPTDKKIELSGRKFGHTFESHGASVSDHQLAMKAKNSRDRIPQGQFTDDQVAAKFIQENLHRVKNGAVSIPVKKDFPARVFMPNGNIVSPKTIRLVPSKTGIETAYPEP